MCIHVSSVSMTVSKARAELGLPAMPCAILPQNNSLRSFFLENCIKRKGKMVGNSYLNTELEHRHSQLQLICSDDGCAFSVLSILSNVLLLPQLLLKATCCRIVVFSILNNARQTIANNVAHESCYYSLLKVLKS